MRSRGGTRGRCTGDRLHDAARQGRQDLCHLQLTQRTPTGPALEGHSRTLRRRSISCQGRLETVARRAETAALTEMIDRFLAGDHSRDFAKQIEGLVVQSFQDAEWYDEVGLALALYAPAERGSE